MSASQSRVRVGNASPSISQAWDPSSWNRDSLFSVPFSAEPLPSASLPDPEQNLSCSVALTVGPAWSWSGLEPWDCSLRLSRGGAGPPTRGALDQSPPRGGGGGAGRTGALLSWPIARACGSLDSARPPQPPRAQRGRHAAGSRDFKKHLRGSARPAGHRPRWSSSGPGSPSAGSRKSSREASGAADPGDVAGLVLSAGPGLPAPKLATLTLYPDPGPFTPSPTLDPELQTTWSTL